MKKFELWNGDCLELMKNIPDGSVDLVLTDPPYGTTACKWDSVIPFEPMWEQLNRIIKPNGAICLFGSEPFSTELRHSNLKMYKYDWVWKKDGVTNFANAKKMPMRCIENISVFYKKPPTYNPQGLVEVNKTMKNVASVGGETVRGDVEKSAGKGQLRTKGHKYIQQFTNYPTQFIEFKRDKDKLHPTQKPVALLEYLIKTYTNEGEVVLDNCMGSGSTGVACVNLKRNFIGMELKEEYFKIAEERINNARLNQPTGGD